MVEGWFIGLGGSVSVSVCGVRKKWRGKRCEKYMMGMMGQEVGL